jgi:methionyl-tRNA formyltransferase
LLLSVLQLFEQGIPEGIPQDPTKVTFAPKIESQEGLIDWNLPAQTLHNLIRGLSPKPGASCFFTPIPLVTQTLAMRPNQFLNHEKDKIRLKIFKSTVVKQQGTPGQWLSKEALIACGENALLLLEVQPEGKKKMSGADWLRGFHIFPKMCS